MMLNEVVEALSLPAGGRALDLTLGPGGHAEALLSNADSGALYLGIDRDAEARSAAMERLGHDGRFSALASTYEDVWTQPGFLGWVAENAPEGFDVIFADLGMSSLQLRDPNRGFSFMATGPLDMRMDQGSGISALEWLEQQDETTLADTLYKFGGERASRRIARAVLAALGDGRLKTTVDLAEAVYSILPRSAARRNGRVDPATRTFQAIRIAVNSELAGLGKTIETAAVMLKPFGRIGVISFHSLEDRIVKQTYRRLAGIFDGPGREPPEPLPKYLQLIYPGGVRPGQAECMQNPPSRSARLRLARRVPCNKFEGLPWQ